MSGRDGDQQQEKADQRVTDALAEIDVTDSPSLKEAIAQAEQEESSTLLSRDDPEDTIEAIWDPEFEETDLRIDVSLSDLSDLDESTVTAGRNPAVTTALIAYGNGISEVPDWIENLSSLEDLDLSENELTNLPDALGRISTLRRLFLGKNSITELPEHLFQLQNLVFLDLSSNNISDIPDAIQGLRAVREIDLRNNQISTMSEKIGKLKNLTTLDLSSNRLKRLPNTVGGMTGLIRLNASSNDMRTIPPTVQWLNKLEVIDLSANEITILPSQIGQLRSLKSLDLSNNNIKKLPPELGKLSSLEYIDLSYNNLVDLPRELGNLSDTVKINLENNPLAEPLPTLLNRGTSALLTYLRSLGDGVPQYEAKVLLVGEGGVGKSSLIAALRDEGFVANRPTTHGIEVNNLRLKHPQIKRNIQLNTWDFGGQEVYRITHQFFFSKRALYLVVWKPREGQEENNVESWCKRIRLRVGDHARIIIVATHGDERRAELDFKYLQSKYPNLLVGYYIVDSESGSGVPELRKSIAIEASKLPQMGEIISQSWQQARDEILVQEQAQIKRVTLERICSKHGLDEADTETLSALLHDLGHLIHYGDDDGLRDIVVLQPEWITKAIGYVLEDEATREQGGVLEHGRLPEIWGDPSREMQYETNLYRYFLRLMEKFDVSYRLSTGDKSLVAQLVPYERPHAIWQDRSTRSIDRKRLRVVCRTAEEAPGLISWLTVRNHRFATGNHWRRGVLLSHTQYGSDAVFELDANNNTDLSLTVVGPSPDYFFHVLTDGLEELIQQRWRGLTYEFLVPCPNADSAAIRCKGNISYNALRKFRERGDSTVPCMTCANWFDVTELLTGFGRMSASINTVLHELRDVAINVETLRARSAWIAQHVRTIIKVLSTEVTDCPRLFTLVPADRSVVIAKLSPKDKFELTLWCEEPGNEHPHPEATYKFLPPKGWIETVSPYVKFVVNVLRFAVPIGVTAYGAAITEEQLKTAKADLDLMKIIAEKLPESDFQADTVQRGMTKAQGAALRSLRTLLGTLDPSSEFGDLRRTVTPSGDILWVCPKHYRQYDPGLPEL